MKVALVFPNLFEIERFGTEQIFYPLSIGYIAAVLEKASHIVKIFDAAAEKCPLQKLLVNLKNFDPDVIGFTTNISSAYMGKMTAKWCKKRFPGKFIVMGGPWATSMYENLLQNNVVDIVVLGEGEETIVDLVSTIELGNSLDMVRGIAFKNGEGEIVLTEERNLIENLDEIPFPAWHLFPRNGQYTMNRRGKHAFPIITSRGCPLSCIHCTKLIFRNELRRRSSKNVIEEIIYLRKTFHMDEILIVDDNFTLINKHVIRILLDIAHLPFKVKINLSNGVRADTLTEKLLDSMRYAGVYRIALGIESGNQNIVNKIGKHLALTSVEKVALILRKRYNFITMGFFIIGHLYDTSNTMLETINFAKKLDLDLVSFFKNIIFPGTEQFQIVEKLGGYLLYRPEGGFTGGYYRPHSSFETPYLKAKSIESAIRLAYRRFYLRPLKILKIIAKLRPNYETISIIRNGLITLGVIR